MEKSTSCLAWLSFHIHQNFHTAHAELMFPFPFPSILKKNRGALFFKETIWFLVFNPCLLDWAVSGEHLENLSSMSVITHWSVTSPAWPNPVQYSSVMVSGIFWIMSELRLWFVIMKFHWKLLKVEVLNSGSKANQNLVVIHCLLKFPL